MNAKLGEKCKYTGRGPLEPLGGPVQLRGLYLKLHALRGESPLMSIQIALECKLQKVF